MQLTGPPRINGWTAPMPIKDAPLEGTWIDEREDRGRVQTNRAGTKTYVGEPQWRGRWTVTWDGISYRTAQRILFEMGAANAAGITVGGSGVSLDEFIWTPRTVRQGAKREPLDLNGDGLIDVVLQEVEIPCILTEQPSTTPIYRTDGNGNKLARLQLEFESTETYAKRAGFGFPPTISFAASGQAGDKVLVEMLGPDGSLTNRVAQVRVRQDRQTIDTFPLGDFPYQLPSDGDFGFALVAAPDFESITEILVRGPVDISTLSFAEVEDASKLKLRSLSGAGPFGQTGRQFYPPNPSTLILGQPFGGVNGTYTASEIPESTEDKLSLRRQTVIGSLSDVPPAETLDVRKADFSTQSTPPQSWWAGGVKDLNAAQCGANINLDEARKGDTGITRIFVKGNSRAFGDVRQFLQNVRTISRLRKVDASGDDLSGDDIITPLSRFDAVLDTYSIPPSDFSESNGDRYNFQCISPAGVTRTKELSVGSAPLSAVSSPSSLASTDGIIGALENGVDLSTLTLIIAPLLQSPSSSPIVIGVSFYDKILSYTDHPNIILRDQDRPRLLTSVDQSPTQGDIAIDVNDPNSTMYNLLGNSPPNRNRRWVSIRLLYAGDVDGRWLYVDGSKSRPDGSTTRIALTVEDSTNGSPLLDQHSTALLHLGLSIT